MKKHTIILNTKYLKYLQISLTSVTHFILRKLCVLFYFKYCLSQSVSVCSVEKLIIYTANSTGAYITPPICISLMWLLPANTSKGASNEIEISQSTVNARDWRSWWNLFCIIPGGFGGKVWYPYSHIYVFPDILFLMYLAK